MTKLRYSNTVIIQNNRIRRSSLIGIKNATEEQKQIISGIKPMMNAWLKAKIVGSHKISNANIVIKTKYTETTQGLSIDFKIQSIEQLG